MSEPRRKTRPLIFIVTIFYLMTLFSEIDVVRTLSESRAPSTEGLTSAVFVIFTTTIMYFLMLRFIRLIR